MRMKWVLGGLCAIFVFGGLRAEVTQTKGIFPEPELRLGKMPQAPTIDGRIDAAEWAGAAQMQKFCLLKQKYVLNAEAEFWLGRDADNIYIAVRREIGPCGLTREVKPTGHSNELCFRDDCVEFDFIRDWHEKRPTLLHLIVNFNGAFHATGIADGKSVSWDGMEEFVSAAQERDGMLEFEFSIPIKNIRFGETPEAVKGIRIAANWYKLGGFYGVQTTWSPQDSTFQTAANCPKVVFDDEAPVVQMTDLGTHHKGQGAMEAYKVAAMVSNPTTRPLSLKIAYQGRPVNSQPCVFSEVFTLQPGESRAFKSTGACLNDELIDFDFKVTSEDGQLVYYTRRLQFQGNWKPLPWVVDGKEAKAVKFDFAFYPSRNLIAAKVDLSKVKNRPSPAKFSLALSNFKGEAIAVTNVVASGAVTDLFWPIPDLEPITIRTGEPKYRLRLKVDGVKDGDVEGSFYRHDLREWEGNSIGLSDTVVPPFTPLQKTKVQGSDGEELEKVSVVLRDHLVDSKSGLWRQVTAAGKDLLARPIRLVEMIRDKEEGIRNKEEGVGVRCRAEKEKRGGKGEGIRRKEEGLLAMQSSWDYDGCMKWQVTLPPGHYEPLALEIPLKGAEARLMHACVDGLRHNYAGAVPPGKGRVYDSLQQGGRVQIIGDFMPYIWIGGTLRGVAVFGENDKGWVLGDGTGKRVPCTEVIREDDGTVVIRLNLVQRAVDTTEPRTIKLGFQATPVKPMLKGWRGISIGQFIGSEYYWGNQCSGVEPFDGTTEFFREMKKARDTGKTNNAYVEDALKRFIYRGKPGDDRNLAHKEKIRRHFYAGMHEMMRAHGTDLKFVFYTNARGIEFGVKAAATYADEWFRWEYLGRLDRDFARNEERAYDLDPVKSFRDYAVFWYKRMIETGAAQALYWDDIYASGNFSIPMCEAYRLPNGEIQPGLGLFAMKELVRRCAVMQTEIGANPTDNWIHMTNTAYAPVSAFAGVHYDWEDTADLQTFQDRYGRDYILASAIGRQMGCRVAVMGYISKTTPENLAWLERTGVGVTLCHELLWPRVKQWREANGLLEKWGYRTDDVEVWNYWDEDVPYPVTLTGDDNVSLAMAKKKAARTDGGGEAVIVVCDWGNGGEIRVKPDCAMLGIDPSFTATDMETGKSVKVEHGEAVIHLKKHDYMILKLGR